MKLSEFRLTGANIFNVFGALVILYLVVMLGQTIENNYNLGQQISGLKTQIGSLQQQKKELSYDIAYYNTAAYQDREARAELGLQLPGENVIIIPNDSPSPSSTPVPSSSSSTQTHKSNPTQWLDFLSGKL